MSCTHHCQHLELVRLVNVDHHGHDGDLRTCVRLCYTGCECGTERRARGLARPRARPALIAVRISTVSRASCVAATGGAARTPYSSMSVEGSGTLEYIGFLLDISHVALPGLCKCASCGLLPFTHSFESKNCGGVYCSVAIWKAEICFIRIPLVNESELMKVR